MSRSKRLRRSTRAAVLTVPLALGLSGCLGSSSQQTCLQRTFTNPVTHQPETTCIGGQNSGGGGGGGDDSWRRDKVPEYR